MFKMVTLYDNILQYWYGDDAFKLRNICGVHGNGFQQLFNPFMVHTVERQRIICKIMPQHRNIIQHSWIFQSLFANIPQTLKQMAKK